jgi:hypothetical protein
MCDTQLVYRDTVYDMFYHGFDNYMTHAFPHDELLPLSCQGQDTLGAPLFLPHTRLLVMFSLNIYHIERTWTRL